MSRQACIDATVGCLREMPEFSPEQAGAVSAYDHRVVGQGLDRLALVTHVRGEARPLVHGWDWWLSIDVWIRTNNDLPAARRKSSEIVQAVLDYLALPENITLKDAVIESEVTQTQVISETLAYGQGVFLVEAITLRVREAR